MTETKGNKRLKVIVPRPDRVRHIGRQGFGWIDAQLHRQGWLEMLGADGVAVYTFLCLVADRQGVSWYRRDRIRQALTMNEEQVQWALQRLRELDLVAYRPFSQHASEGFHQVLSVPLARPVSAGQPAWVDETD